MVETMSYTSKKLEKSVYYWQLGANVQNKILRHPTKKARYYQK